LAVAQAKLQKSAEALDSLRLAGEVRGKYPERTAEDYYILACISAQTASLLENDQPAIAGQNADQAMASLTQALRAGYKDVTRIKEDIALDPLRSREDFKKLVTELVTKK
jgi:hypothetical protein